MGAELGMRVVVGDRLGYDDRRGPSGRWGRLTTAICGFLSYSCTIPPRDHLQRLPTSFFLTVSKHQTAAAQRTWRLGRTRAR